MPSPLPVQAVVRTLKSLNPKSPIDLKKAFHLQRVGRGVFRSVYLISGSQVVIKFPVRCVHETGVVHSNREIRFLRRAQSSRYNSILRPYLPVLLYSDRKTGVVAMTYHKRCRVKRSESVSCKFIRDILSLAGLRCHDIHEGNLGQNKHDVVPRIIDLGY